MSEKGSTSPRASSGFSPDDANHLPAGSGSAAGSNTAKPQTSSAPHQVGVGLSKRKPDLKLDGLPPPHLFQSQSSKINPGESILEKNSNKGDNVNDENYSAKQSSQHAHFLDDDVAGHQGQPARPRSASGSDRALDGLHGEYKAGVLRRPSRIAEEQVLASLKSSLPSSTFPSHSISNIATTTNGLVTGPLSTTGGGMATVSGGSAIRDMVSKAASLLGTGSAISSSRGSTVSGGLSSSQQLNPLSVPSSLSVTSSGQPKMSTTTNSTVPNVVPTGIASTTLTSKPSSTSSALRTTGNSATSAGATTLQPSTVSGGDPRLPQDDGKLHILLGATGAVSTGKLRQIILKLEEIYGKSRVSIQIILTKAAENFVSRGEIPSNVRIWRDKDEWETWKSRTDPVVHIELRRWADVFVIAPLSANTLGKIALGLCDNLLTNVVRAWNTQYPILIAPAMSSYAYNHPATKRHLKVIKEDMKWIEILKPTEKVVGSYGDIGMGGMMDWNEIVNRIVMKLGGYPDDDDDEDDDNDEDNKDDDNDDDNISNDIDDEVIEDDDGIGKVSLAEEEEMEEMERHKKLRESRSFT